MSGQTHFRFPALQFCLSGAEFQAQAPGPGQEKCVFGFPQVSTKTQRKITQMAVCQNLVPLVNIKIAGKWMFIPLKMVLIGIDPHPNHWLSPSVVSLARGGHDISQSPEKLKEHLGTWVARCGKGQEATLLPKLGWPK